MVRDERDGEGGWRRGCVSGKGKNGEGGIVRVRDG